MTVQELPFLDRSRTDPAVEEVFSRTKHFNEYEQVLSGVQVKEQAERCMQCSVPFCHSGCPTSNLIPEFTEAVTQGNMLEAWKVLSETNPFPEFTGRVCPAPCEQVCCLGAIREPVSIKAIERAIGDWAFEKKALRPIVPLNERHQRVTIIGSGPCGLAAAVRLRQEGYKVRIFEREKFAGGLLKYGIPDYKLEKSVVQRRIEWLKKSGAEIITGVQVGKDVPVEEVLRSCDALALAVGYEWERPLTTIGADKRGVLKAMDFLREQNKAKETGTTSKLSVAGKKVIVLGGGDTGWDCVGTAIRQGATRVLRLTSRKRLPQVRPADNLWPEVPQTQRNDTQTEECASEMYDVRLVEIMGDESVQAVRCERVLNRSEKQWNRKRDAVTIEADCVIVAQGFELSGSEKLYDILGISHSGGTLITEKCRTNRPMVFAGGDAVIGPSLVVTAIRSGLEMAESIVSYFEMG